MLIWYFKISKIVFQFATTVIFRISELKFRSTLRIKSKLGKNPRPRIVTSRKIENFWSKLLLSESWKCEKLSLINLLFQKLLHNLPGSCLLFYTELDIKNLTIS